MNETTTMSDWNARNRTAGPLDFTQPTDCADTPDWLFVPGEQPPMPEGDEADFALRLERLERWRLWCADVRDGVESKYANHRTPGVPKKNSSNQSTGWVIYVAIGLSAAVGVLAGFGITTLL